MQKRIALELEGDLDALRLVWGMMDEVMQFLPQENIQEEDKYATMVAVQEIVTNVIRHAHGGDPSKPLRVEFETEEETLRVTTIDLGPPFDPEACMQQPDEENPAEGGYGLYFMRTVMNDYTYERQGSRNVLTMVKDFARQVAMSGAGERSGV